MTQHSRLQHFSMKCQRVSPRNCSTVTVVPKPYNTLLVSLTLHFIAACQLLSLVASTSCSLRFFAFLLMNVPCLLFPCSNLPSDSTSSLSLSDPPLRLATCSLMP